MASDTIVRSFAVGILVREKAPIKHVLTVSPRRRGEVAVKFQKRQAMFGTLFVGESKDLLFNFRGDARRREQARGYESGGKPPHSILKLVECGSLLPLF